MQKTQQQRKQEALEKVKRVAKYYKTRYHYVRMETINKWEAQIETYGRLYRII